MAKANLTACRKCDELVARFAKTCPNCGVIGPTKCIWIALVAIVLWGMVGYGLFLLWDS